MAFSDQRAADLRAVGFASDVPGMLARHVAKSVAGAVNNKDAFGYVGIATHGPWHTEAGEQEFDVYLDDACATELAVWLSVGGEVRVSATVAVTAGAAGPEG